MKLGSRVSLRTLVLVFCSAAITVAQSSTDHTKERDSKKHIAATADTIVLHGRVYTVNTKQPWAQAVAISGGKILAVGDDAEVNRLRGKGTKVLDAGGRLVLPGFADCHIHFLEGSLGLDRANLQGAKNTADIQQILRNYAAKHPGQGWILGSGWNYAMFGEENLPHKKYLDELFQDRPVFLVGFDGHTSWANSKALALAGITKDTADPANGAIVRDKSTREPTGALKESASQLLDKVIPKSTRSEKLASLRSGVRWANENGLTRVHSAGGDFEEFDLYDELRRHGDLTVRFYIAYFLNPPELRPQDIATIEDARSKYAGEWLAGGVVKMMLDGVVESHTAAMLEPYTDDPSTKGNLFWDPDKYKATVAQLDKRGLQLFTHAIGDDAVRTALDAYEGAQKANHTTDRRARIEHIETITAQDIPRFGQLGVIASMQPLHSYPDENTLHVWAGNNGPDRASRGFAWHDIAASGGRLAFGSDWNVVTLNPWHGLQLAVTRQTFEGKPEGGWLPNERVTLAQAVEAYTLGAAFAGRREKWEGSIEQGKLADLIIVSQNIFEIDPHKIAETKVDTTIVGGRVVYQANGK
ncbi:MAG TPA: amidohydrolase family protein [Candidatus Dormibacteraeota bacterium]|nr:amidohydrolase family protein [Candidatus Dormibacteraeota bacterium]